MRIQKNPRFFSRLTRTGSAVRCGRPDALPEGLSFCSHALVRPRGQHWPAHPRSQVGGAPCGPGESHTWAHTFCPRCVMQPHLLRPLGPVSVLPPLLAS